MRYWTKEEAELCRSLAAQGLHAVDIAERMGTGRNKNMVIGFCNHNGIPLPPPYKSERTRLQSVKATQKAPQQQEAYDASAFSGKGKFSLLEAGTQVCHWPLGNHPDMTACGAPVHRHSYCQHHYLKAYRL